MVRVPRSQNRVTNHLCPVQFSGGELAARQTRGIIIVSGLPETRCDARYRLAHYRLAHRSVMTFIPADMK